MEIEKLEKGKLYKLDSNVLYIKINEGTFVEVTNNEKIYLIDYQLFDEHLGIYEMKVLLPNKEQKGIIRLHKKTNIFSEFKEWKKYEWNT